MAVKPDKVIFISATGGWKDDKTGNIVPEINMTNSYEELAARDYTGRQGTLLKLKEINSILSGLPASSSVVITAADKLASHCLPVVGCENVRSKLSNRTRVLGRFSVGLVKHLSWTLSAQPTLPNLTPCSTGAGFPPTSASESRMTREVSMKKRLFVV